MTEPGTPNPSPPAWTAQLPADLKGNETLTAYESIGDLAGAFIEKHGKVSELEGELENRVILPGEKASDEERAAFYARLGRPDDPDGYELARPELPEGLPYDEASEKYFRQAFLEANLTKEQAAAVYGRYMSYVKDAFTKAEEMRDKQRDDAIAQLTQEYGGEEPFKAQVELGRRAAEKIGGKEFQQFLEKSGWGNIPIMVKVFAEIGKLIGNDQYVPGEGPGGGPGRSPAEMMFPDMKQAEAS